MTALNMPAQPGNGAAPSLVREHLARMLARCGAAGPLWRAAAVVLCVAAAYHYSLQTLVEEVGQDTPLAYLGLVPLLTLLLVAVLARPRRSEADIHDRYLDYIVGVPLLTVAMLLLILAPEALSNTYWLRRLDLVSLPLFVAGAISIAFGTRALWRLRAAVAFLLLAWPYPYVLFLDHGLAWFTNATATAVTTALKVIPVASVQPDGDFLIAHTTGLSSTFSLSVSSACSGINSGVGFLIVGGAAAILMRGRRSLKLLWLAAGTALLFAVNVGRILVILGAGRVWGEHVAVDILHPLLGLVAILGATLVMLLLLPRFRLSLDLAAPARARSMAKLSAPRPLAVRRARVPLLLIAGASLVAMVANSGMTRYELLAFGLGPPRLAATSLASAPIQGWTLTESAAYTWAPRYFGTSGTWTRYSEVETAPTGDTAAPAAITVDVIGTADLNTFSTYGLEACYGFHNYTPLSSQRIDMGGGLNAKAMRYLIPGQRAYWLALYWEWPVRVTGTVRFQRVVLSVDSSLTSNQPDQQRLVNLARQLIQQAAHQASASGALEF